MALPAFQELMVQSVGGQVLCWYLFPPEGHLQQEVGGEGQGAHWTLLGVSIFGIRELPRRGEGQRRKAAGTDPG